MLNTWVLGIQVCATTSGPLNFLNGLRDETSALIYRWEGPRSEKWRRSNMWWSWGKLRHHGPVVLGKCESELGPWDCASVPFGQCVAEVSGSQGLGHVGGRWRRVWAGLSRHSAGAKQSLSKDLGNHVMAQLVRCILSECVWGGGGCGVLTVRHPAVKDLKLSWNWPKKKELESH